MSQLTLSWRFWVGILAMASVMGCSNVESEFLDALNASDKKVCVDVSELGIAMYSSRDGKSYLAAEENRFAGRAAVKALDALRERGYARKEPYFIQADIVTKVRGYEITEKGRAHFQRQGPVCIGERHATEIIDYSEPPAGGPVQSSQVNFKYDVEFNDFIDDLGLGEELHNNLTLLRNTEGKGRAAFVKTNKGWRLENAMW